MLEEWYCRSIANNNADAEDDDDDSPEEEVPNYKDQYRNLKRKLKFLIYVCTMYIVSVSFVCISHTILFHRLIIILGK